MITRIRNLPAHNQTFSYPHTITILTDFANPQIDACQQVPKLQNPTYHYTEEGIYQIWDTYLHPPLDNPVKKAVLC